MTFLLFPKILNAQATIHYVSDSITRDGWQLRGYNATIDVTKNEQGKPCVFTTSIAGSGHLSVSYLVVYAIKIEGNYEAYVTYPLRDYEDGVLKDDVEDDKVYVVFIKDKITGKRVYLSQVPECDGCDVIHNLKIER